MTFCTYFLGTMVNLMQMMSQQSQPIQLQDLTVNFYRTNMMIDLDKNNEGSKVMVRLYQLFGNPKESYISLLPI